MWSKRQRENVTNLSVCSWVKFYATDGCGNSPVVLADVEFRRKQNRLQFVTLKQIVTLTTAVQKSLQETFDDGSRQLVRYHFQVRRMNAGNCSSPIVSDTSFRDFVEFICSDVLESKYSSIQSL